MLNIIQPDIWFSRKTSPIVAAMAPVVSAPFIHETTHNAAIAVIMMPLRTATAARTDVIIRVRRVTAPR